MRRPKPFGDNYCWFEVDPGFTAGPNDYCEPGLFVGGGHFNLREMRRLRKWLDKAIQYLEACETNEKKAVEKIAKKLGWKKI